VSFTKIEKAEQAIHDGEIDGVKWHKRKTNETYDGEKIRYKCQKNCPKEMFLLLHADIDAVTVYLSDNEHQHIDQDKGLPKETMAKVEELLQLNTQNCDILRTILRLGLPQITDVQLRNFKSRYTSEKLGKSNILLNELAQWCTDHKQVPEDLDTPFVACSRFEVARKSKEIEKLNVVITTKRLLSIALKRKDILICDATYKLIWQGFPVFVVGTVDFAKKFHPIAVMVTKTEQQTDLEFLFETLKNSIREIYNEEYEPEFLLADAAHACTNGFKRVFKDSSCKRIICWAHVIRAIDKKLNSLDRATSQAIRKDILLIQASNNAKIFHKALELFDKKWRTQNPSKINDFLNYFKQEWCTEANEGYILKCIL
jgi:hypothetical protein